MPKTLEKRPYGATGEQVTVIGLGGSYLDKSSLAEGIATVHHALELGITYFDTAPAYGRGASQVIMGHALEGCAAPHMLATKLGYLATPGDFRSPYALRAQLWENLRALRKSRVDVLQIHLAELACWWKDGEQTQLLNLDEAYDFANAPIMQVLREAQTQGLCRFIGITADRADVIAHILCHVEVDACLVAYDYTPLCRRARNSVLPVARSRGIAYIAAGVIKPVIGEQGISSNHRLNALQQASGFSLVTLTIRYLIVDPAITTILVGAATPDEIEESVMAAQAGPLPSDLHQAIEDLVPER